MKRRALHYCAATRHLRVGFCGLLLMAVPLAGCSEPNSTKQVEIPGSDGQMGAQAQVLKVIDGDTVEARIGSNIERLRLLGIDTPETVKPNSPVECFGPEASKRTKELLSPGTEILLQRDEQARDRYGRLLVYAWLSDGKFVNASLLRDGFADTLFIKPNFARRSELSAARAEAKAEKKGMWGTCPP